GRGGETVRGICRSSGASVQCEREAQAGVAPVRHIQLLGTRSQVAAAKVSRWPKGEELPAPGVAVPRFEGATWTALGDPWLRPLGSVLLLVLRPQGVAQTSLGSRLCPCEWHLGGSPPAPISSGTPPGARGCHPPLPGALPVVPSPDFSFQADEHLEVYVSAAENPNHFWVQLVGQRSLELDKLAAEMSQHYQSCAGHMAELLDVQAGDIVAAPYQDGSSWYRARVLGTLENGNFDLYYVDFGDNGEAPREALRALRSDFLSLPFQAIE
ncbi:Tudor and KH domain-containing protein, partial [Dryobates pubescens]